MKGYDKEILLCYRQIWLSVPLEKMEGRNVSSGCVIEAFNRSARLILGRVKASRVALKALCRSACGGRSRHYGAKWQVLCSSWAIHRRLSLGRARLNAALALLIIAFIKAPIQHPDSLRLCERENGIV